MPGIRKQNKLLWFMTALIFLSLVQSAPLAEQAACDFAASGVRCQQFTAPLQNTAQDYRPPENTVKVLFNRLLRGEMAQRETLLPALSTLPLPRIAAREILRHSDSPGITLWRNLYYIHRKDGKKEGSSVHKRNRA